MNRKSEHVLRRQAAKALRDASTIPVSRRQVEHALIEAKKANAARPDSANGVLEDNVNDHETPCDQR